LTGRRILRAALPTLPLVLFACATQPNFSYDDGDGSAPLQDGRALLDSSTDSTVGDDGSLATTDASDDGSAPEEASSDQDGGAMDAGSFDAGDAAVQSGCGPLDSPSNCGACGVACDMMHSNDAACTFTGDAGVCSYSSCATGFADCDASAPNANGCDTPITTLTNCGACGVACDTANSVDASCGANGCSYVCAPGYGDCNATPPNVNGCTTPITTPLNCGACGVACNTTNSVDAGCGPTGCTYTCAPNFSNCNTTSAPSNTGGCACNTPACCATSGATPGAGGPAYTCETTHSNGVGESFYDCEPAGTYTLAQATTACQKFVETLGLADSACAAPDCSNGTYTANYDAIYYYNTTTHVGYVWVYQGTPAYFPLGLPATTTGVVYAGSTFCSTARPAAGVGTWN
jgi:hypothetical protein